VTAAKARDQNLTGDFDWVVFVACFIKGIFDSVDDLVSDLEVFLGHLLVLVDLLDQVFNVLQLPDLELGLERELHLGVLIHG